MSNAAKTKVGGTYYEIVKAQYKKNGPAVWSLWTQIHGLVGSRRASQ